MRLSGLGATNDTSVLGDGTIVSFTVTGGPVCSGVYEADIRNTLNNWAGQMLKIVSISTNASGYVPTVVNVDVVAQVIGDHSAGSIRAQIMQALAALSDSVFLTTCATGVELKDGVLSIAPGGSNPGLPPDDGSGIPWSTATVMIAAAALFAVVVWKS